MQDIGSNLGAREQATFGNVIAPKGKTALTRNLQLVDSRFGKRKAQGVRLTAPFLGGGIGKRTHRYGVFLNNLTTTVGAVHLVIHFAEIICRNRINQGLEWRTYLRQCLCLKRGKF